MMGLHLFAMNVLYLLGQMGLQGWQIISVLLLALVVAVVAGRWLSRRDDEQRMHRQISDFLA